MYIEIYACMYTYLIQTAVKSRDGDRGCKWCVYIHVCTCTNICVKKYMYKYVHVKCMHLPLHPYKYIH